MLKMNDEDPNSETEDRPGRRGNKFRTMTFLKRLILARILLPNHIVKDEVLKD